jgi:hypothetical protein
MKDPATTRMAAHTSTTFSGTTMNTTMKRALTRRFPNLSACYSLVASGDSYLHSSGWIESKRRGYPCRPDGTELPWMNYAVIAFLERRLNQTLSVFEYGSGYSTLFYARRVRSVISVEYDQAWYASIGPRLPSNAKLLFVPHDVDGDYCRAIARGGDQFDVVVVDGKDRVNCVKQSMQALSSRGVIVLDDSERAKYAPAISYAQDNGFLTLDFEGIKPTYSTWCRSTLLYRRENCLGL